LILPLATPPEQDVGPRGAWRADLLTLLGWILFLALTPLVLYLSHARGSVDSNQQLAEMLGYTRDELIGMPVLELVSPEHRDRVVGVLDGNPLPMLVYDPDSLRFVAVKNASAVEQYGYGREELLRMSVGDLALPGDPLYAEFFVGLGQPRAAVLHVGLRQQRRRDGSVIDIDLTSLEVPFARRTARLTLARDVTAERQAAAERARLQAAVERAAAEWQRTFDAVESALVVFDTSVHVVRLNRSAAALVRTSERDAILGRHVGELGAHEPGRPPPDCWTRRPRRAPRCPWRPATR
jgi:PAS domain-containing protein